MSGLLDKITDACDQATKDGIQLVRGPIFDWTGPDPKKPKACDALGAVLWVNGRAEKGRMGWWADLIEILDVGPFWLYRWCIGWDNLHQLIIYTEGKGGVLIPHQDDVSMAARSLSKRRCR